MDRVRIGYTFRSIRVELRLRQADVAHRARLSQQLVSSVERGLLGSTDLDTLERIAQALQADLSMTLRWRGPKLARLLDQRHAALQNAVIAELCGAGWTVVAEESFNHFGERGSVDILAWLPSSRALLIIEIKTEIVDLQELLRTLDMKERLVPGLVRRSRRWQPQHVATVVVLPSGNSHRRVAAAHAALLDSTLPARTAQVRRWIWRPSGAIHCIWFFPCTPGQSGMERLRAPRRVCVGRGRPSPRTRASRPRGDGQKRASEPDQASSPNVEAPI